MGTQTRRWTHLPSLGLPLWVGLLLGVVGWAFATPTTPTPGFQPGQLSFSATHVRTGQPFGSAPLFSPVALAPGQVVAESVRVRNTGDLPFALHLHATADGALSGADGGLQAQVERGDGTTLYRGPLHALDAKLRGRLEAQEEDQFRVSVWLAPGAQVAPASGSATVSFSLYAEQAL
ncbi:MAG: hypothetical protein HY690_20675 [Chloroflexi bacterium]|nr:hypothetical protein [Chloroflexota bacterium]